MSAVAKLNSKLSHFLVKHSDMKEYVGVERWVGALSGCHSPCLALIKGSVRKPFRKFMCRLWL